MKHTQEFQIPRHVAIIMDANGRWASQRGLPRLEGHKAGFINIRKVVAEFARYKIKYVTIYALSTENRARRPLEEVDGLLHIMQEHILELAEELHQKNVKLVHLGKNDCLPKRLREDIEYSLNLTQHNDGMVLCVAFDYGGRAEILCAIRKIVEDHVPAHEVNEALFSRYLYTATIPDPDLIIRTGGEFRLSNFLLWQSAYSEYLATDVLWPDFGQKEIDQAIKVYSHRQRRFGALHTAK